MKPESGHTNFTGIARLISKAVSAGLLIALWQTSAYAFPTKNQLQPFGVGVVANGYARLPGKSAVGYIESYLDDPMDDTVRATYWSPGRYLMGYKELKFGNHSNLPEFFQVVDYRRDKGYTVTIDGKVANVKVVDTSDKNNHKTRLNKNVNITDNTVIDASFQRYIISQWDKLLNNKPLRVKFLQIDKGRLIPLKVRKTNCDTPDTTCLKITFDNILLQGILPHAEMKYDSASKKLIRYSGIGPVTRMNGKVQSVTILYEHLQ